MGDSLLGLRGVVSRFGNSYLIRYQKYDKTRETAKAVFLLVGGFGISQPFCYNRSVILFFERKSQPFFLFL